MKDDKIFAYNQYRANPATGEQSWAGVTWAPESALHATWTALEIMRRKEGIDWDRFHWSTRYEVWESPLGSRGRKLVAYAAWEDEHITVVEATILTPKVHAYLAAHEITYDYRHRWAH